MTDRRHAATVGLLLHGATALLYAPSTLVAPGVGVAVLFAGWFSLLALGLRWRQRNPMLVVALPVMSLVLWAGLITFGDAHLGWTG